MNTGACKRLDVQSWKDLYQAAMCESDMNKLLERIADAETALAMRPREVFYTSGDRFEKEESLDDAMCVLSALAQLKRRPFCYSKHASFGSPKTRVTRQEGLPDCRHCF